MKLKEIKQDMAIHCTSRDQLQCLVNIGVADENLTKYDVPIWIHVFGNGICCWMPEVDKNGMKGKEFYEKDGCHCVEFSDLIIPEPELSAEEALLAYDQMCRENYCCNDCPIYGILGHECTRKMDGHIGEIVDAIKRWKSDHEKKEPEIETEWFWQGRIFKVEKDGSYYQIKDGNGFYDTGCEYQESAEEYMSDILKEYCKTHDGDFISVVNHVCRVKAVE